MSQAAHEALRSRGWLCALPQQFFPHRPRLIIANHPSALDPFILLMHCREPHTFMISAETNRHFGKAFAKQMLPVHIGYGRPQFWLDAVRLPYLRRIESVQSKEEAREKNRQAIARAAELVESGETVIIFPSGLNPTGKNWRPGVGFLVAALQNPEIEIGFWHTPPVSWWEMLRFTFLGRWLSFLPTRNIQPQYHSFRLSQFHPSARDGKTIAQELEHSYFSLYQT